MEQEQGAVERQNEYAAWLREGLRGEFGRNPQACVRTFGCQGNQADSERLRGWLALCGFTITQNEAEADLMLYNTCAVREHAEDRVFGNVGRLKARRAANPKLRIALCGCVPQQPGAAAKLQAHYPFVDLVFGTFALPRLPELLHRLYQGGGRVFDVAEAPAGNAVIAEGLPQQRDSNFKAWVPVMYGCNNFCSYCVVPLVRGRERSRAPQVVLAEVKDLVRQGYKEITLLGQNVNSYQAEGCNFAALLRQIDALEGDFWLRFMTSHPKDCSHELLNTLAEGRHFARHLHLPLQSGSNAILQAMHRRYTVEHYAELLHYARERMPNLSVSSDIIVGFPGETEAQFNQTLQWVQQLRYSALYTFIYSKREGTQAATLPDNVTHEQKVARLQRLTAVQDEATQGHRAAMQGQTMRVLCEGTGQRLALLGRTQGNTLLEFNGDPAWVGQFIDVTVTSVGGAKHNAVAATPVTQT